MPRSNRPRGRKSDHEELPELNLDLIRSGYKRTEVKNGVPCYVQTTNGRSDDQSKSWVCPNCSVAITWGVSHVVAWPLDLSVETRRHFHTRCWQMYSGYLG